MFVTRVIEEIGTVMISPNILLELKDWKKFHIIIISVTTAYQHSFCNVANYVVQDCVCHRSVRV